MGKEWKTVFGKSDGEKNKQLRDNPLFGNGVIMKLFWYGWQSGKFG